MIRTLTAAVLLAAAIPLALPCQAQTAPASPISGTRLDVVATGEVNRAPDIVRINAGVQTQAPSASEAIRRNAEQMRAIRAALRQAGIAERDIQTSAINLSPEWRQAENRAPEFVGYRAYDMVNVRFRDVANAGRILDALVAAGANQIDGPNFGIDRADAVLDEARTRALANARTRADLYAQTLGMRVKRIIAVSESGAAPGPMPYMARLEMAQDSAATNIAPGEQTLTAVLTVSFELE